MKTLQKIFVVVLTIGLLQSCITIEENYLFKKDGSGSMEYVIDMSELGELMKDFDSPDGDLSEDQKNNMDSFVLVLNELDGIKNVSTTDDDWIQKISFDFNDITALNQALAVITEGSSSWKNKGKKWTRTQLEVNNEAIGGNKDGDEDSDDELGAEILSSMKYIVHIKTQKNIKGYKGHDSVEATISKKTATVETDFSELIKDPDVLSFSINLK